MNTNMNRPQNRGLAVAHLAHARAEVQAAAECGCAGYAEYGRALAVLDGLRDVERKTMPMRRGALAEELVKIGGMLAHEGELDALASRLRDIAKHIQKWGVSHDDTDEIEF